MHLLKRESLFLPILQGGLGFRSTSSVNESLIAKQTWRILSSSPTSLIGNTLQTKYVDWSQENFLSKPYNSSGIWNQIRKCSSLITGNLKWSIGNGRSIPLNHPLWWLVQHNSVISTTTSFVADLLVHNVSFSDKLTWNQNLLHFLNPPQTVTEILQ